MIDHKMMCGINKLYDKKLNHFLVIFSKFFHAYLQGLLIKSRTLLLYTNRIFLVPLSTIMKYNLVILSSSLVDIIVVD